MLDKLTIDDFQARAGETFKATPQDGETLELELRRAEPSPYIEVESAEAAEARGRAPFSVEFHSPLPHHVPQQTFTLEHGDMGTFELFLVPLGPDADGQRYEAVFA